MVLSGDEKGFRSRLVCRGLSVLASVGNPSVDATDVLAVIQNGGSHFLKVFISLVHVYVLLICFC